MSVPLIGGGSNLTSIVNTTNMALRELNARQQVNVFKNASGKPGIIQGKLPNDRYGILIYEGTNPRVLIGESPDGTYGIWVSKPGQSVLGAFS